jgi:hypothetical protein
MISQIQHSFDARLKTKKKNPILIARIFPLSQVFTCSPLCFACANVIDLPKDIRISPGVAIERKQQENNSNSHQELINKQI